MFSDKMLRVAAEELARVIIESLPDPSKCDHQFSEKFEKKMQTLSRLISPCVPNADNTKKS